MKFNHPDIAALDACMRGLSDQRRALLPTRAQPDRGYPRDSDTRARSATCDLRKRFQTGQTADENHPRAGLQGAHVGAGRLVFTNILGNRDGEVLEDPGSFKTKEDQAQRSGIHSPTAVYRSSYGKMCTRCASTTIRRAATTKKAGITSHFRLAWLPHANQVDFLCETPSLPRRSCSISFCSSTWRASECAGIQEWLSFYFKSPMTAPGCIRA